MSDPAPDKRRRASPARSAARLAAVQALYQMELGEEGVETIILEFETHRLGNRAEDETLKEADKGFFKGLMRGVIEDQVEIDRSVNDILQDGWPLKRVDSILRAIFRAAGHELLARPDVPHRVVINEYVNVADAFFDGDEKRLANGVLDQLARRLRPTDAGADTARNG
ncbi:MAG: transcription antitermination factor NusB [Pseudomonadota bacterium]